MNKHFDLTVNFGAGSQMGGGTISAFVPAGAANTTLNYKIDAEFNADGVIIRGDAANPNIVYDDFTDGNPNMPKGGGDKHTGILSGIIGEQGVVAAFISIPHATAPTSYIFSGGFVATPIQGASGFLKWGNSLATFPRFVPTAESQFLQGTATGLLTTGTRDSQLSNPAPTVTTVTLADKGLGGEAADGFAFFDGYAGQQHYYAGILSGTDLGAPLTEQPTNTVWRGYIALDGFATVNKSFNLTVNFGAGSQTDGGTLAAFVKVFNNNDVTHYKIDAEFNADGVIVPVADSIVYDEFTGGDPDSPTMASLRHTGMVTGLIGEQGAVGVFIGRTTSRNMSGGFVATPLPPPMADYAGWESSFATGRVNASQPLRDSGFTNAVITTDIVRGTSDYIKLDGDNKIVTSGGTFTPNILRLNETEDVDGYESGFAYAYDTINTTGQTYVGILATTNLGLLLTDNTKNGTWSGRLKGITGVGDSIGSDTATFSLTVTFGGDSDVAGSAGTIKTEGTNGFASINGSSAGIRLIGDFNTAGVMWGRINLGGAVDDNGTFSGLIGAKGAVGVFEGVNPAFSFAGGFEVHPPAP